MKSNLSGSEKFDHSKADSQSTLVLPVKVNDFCFSRFQEHESELNERCSQFIGKDSGVLVYRRMRVAEVFSYGCRDWNQSLEWQLGALKKSMDYKADIPNFLEPWYGIGTVASAFGIPYIWPEGQAPATKPAFQTIDDALNFNFKPVKETVVGKHTLDMIEFFLNKTKGKLPVSMGDIQSPFNNATYIVDTSNFLISMITEPEKVLAFLDLIASLQIDFYSEQRKLIGDCMVKPGHGFASARCFDGFGMSDDNIVMIDADSYLTYALPSFTKLGNAFGGPVLHSCGNYSDKTGIFKKITGLKMVDAAFTPQTDPSPNPVAPFTSELKDSGIILNARMVGEPDTVETTISELWSPGLKMIAVTYSQSPEEQQQVYDLIHQMCQ